MSMVSILICISMSALSLIVAVVPFVVGEVKKRKVIKPVEYFPPAGSSPIDFLTQFYGSSAKSRDLFNAVMLYWASRGFITIEEDCKRGLKLIKLKNLTRPESNDGFDSRTYDIQEQLFEYLFSAKDTFYTLATSCHFKDCFKKITDRCDVQAKKVTSRNSGKYTLISSLTAVASYLGVMIAVACSIENSAIVLGFIFPLAAMGMYKLLIVLPEDDGVPKGSSIRFFLVPFFLAVGLIPATAVMLFMHPVAAAVSGIEMAVCFLILFIVSVKIDIRDDGQLKFYARICGFKNFLILAEARQLEALVEQDPQYYYNILPYCYILNITEKLKPKFDAIALDGPAWYLGDLRDTLMF